MYTSIHSNTRIESKHPQIREQTPPYPRYNCLLSPVQPATQTQLTQAAKCKLQREGAHNINKTGNFVTGAQGAHVLQAVATPVSHTGIGLDAPHMYTTVAEAERARHGALTCPPAPTQSQNHRRPVGQTPLPPTRILIASCSDPLCAGSDSTGAYMHTALRRPARACVRRWFHINGEWCA
jgi:hypothetical protein